MKRKHLHCTPMDLVISADTQSFIAGQNDAELSHEIYQYSISFIYFCGVFRQRNFVKQIQDQPLFSNYLLKDWCKLEMDGLPVAPDGRGWLLEWTHTLLYKESINQTLKDCHKQTSFKQS